MVRMAWLWKFFFGLGPTFLDFDSRFWPNTLFLLRRKWPILQSLTLPRSYLVGHSNRTGHFVGLQAFLHQVLAFLLHRHGINPLGVSVIIIHESNRDRLGMHRYSLSLYLEDIGTTTEKIEKCNRISTESPSITTNHSRPILSRMFTWESTLFICDAFRMRTQVAVALFLCWRRAAILEVGNPRILGSTGLLHDHNSDHGSGRSVQFNFATNRIVYFSKQADPLILGKQNFCINFMVTVPVLFLTVSMCEIPWTADVPSINKYEEKLQIEVSTRWSCSGAISRQFSWSKSVVLSDNQTTILGGRFRLSLRRFFVIRLDSKTLLDVYDDDGIHCVRCAHGHAWRLAQRFLVLVTTVLNIHVILNQKQSSSVWSNKRHTRKSKQ